MNPTLRRLLLRFLLGGVVTYLLLGLLLPGVMAQEPPPPGGDAAPVTSQDAPAAEGDQPPADDGMISLADTKAKSAEIGSTWGQRLQSLFGMFVLLGVCWAVSNNRKKVSWRVVGWGIGLQLILGVFVMKTAAGRWIFDQANTVFNQLIACTTEGASFLFGNLSRVNNVPVGLDASPRGAASDSGQKELRGPCSLLPLPKSAKPTWRHSLSSSLNGGYGRSLI